jgi:hypothetical protein
MMNDQKLTRHLLEGAQLESIPDLEGLESVLVPHVELLHPPLDDLQCEAPRIDGSVGVQSRNHL